MPRQETIRKNLESHIASDGDLQGRKNFVKEVKESIGLLTRTEDGELQESVDENGRRCVAKNRWRPKEYSIRDLAFAIGGQRFVESMKPGGGPDAVDLMEAGPGIDPTTFLNTNLFSATVAGLVDATILESFHHPRHIGDDLFETIPTNKNGEKMPGTYGFQADDGETVRLPGQPHARATIGERWVTTPELVEKALACEVTKEAVFYDLTTEVLARAANIGDILADSKEHAQADLFLGVTNSYNYNGVAYNTYQTAGGSPPWVNSTTNPLEDFTDINTALDLFLDMTNPETNREISVEPDTVVYYQGQSMYWHSVLNGTELRRTTNTNNVMLSTPPPTSQRYKLVEFGQLWYNRILSGFAGEIGADARDYWFIGEPKRCFKWMEAWPLTVTPASPSEYAMLDRGLIAAYFANYRGIGAVVEPRYIVRNIRAT